MQLKSRSLISGNLTLDPSFNRGGDMISFGATATNFTASRSGSSIFLDGSDTDALIPVGSSGATLSFAGDDDRVVLFDNQLPGIRIGAQEITADPVQLAAAM